MIYIIGSYDHQVLGKHKGHVKVNVWRGPSKGHKKHKFAPWGYYAKMPADSGKKHHHGWRKSCMSTFCLISSTEQHKIGNKYNHQSYCSHEALNNSFVQPERDIAGQNDIVDGGATWRHKRYQTRRLDYTSQLESHQTSLDTRVPE